MTFCLHDLDGLLLLDQLALHALSLHGGQALEVEKDARVNLHRRQRFQQLSPSSLKEERDLI